MHFRLFALPANSASRGVLKRAILVLFLFVLAGLAGGMSSMAHAQDVPRAYAGIVVDAKTGNTLYANAADAVRYPASVTKVMTLYVLFQELKAGRMNLNTPLTVSRHAASAEPTKLYVRAGSTIKVEDAIKALVTLSANDVARVIAENIGGTESQFAERMTATARALGMNRTTYANASGLPDRRQVTTVRDQARLAVAIYQHFPTYYEYFQTTSFRYGGNTHGNHNRLLGQNGVDGIKTGYIRASGYNLMTAARKDNRHIVVIAFGFNSGASRNAKVAELVREYMPRARSGSYWAQALIPETAASGAGNVFAVANSQPVTPMPRPANRMPGALIEPIPVQVASTEAIALLPVPEPVATETPGLIPVPVPVPMPAPTAEAIALVEPAPRPEATQVALAPPAPMEPPVDLLGNSASQAIVSASTGTPAPTQPDRPLDIIGAWLSDSFELGADTGNRNVADNRPSGALTLLPPAEIGGGQTDTPHGEPAIDLMNSSSIETAALVETSWVIQIGAAQTEDGARDLLQDATTQLTALTDLRPYVEQTVSSGQTYYRARFSGFAGRDEAQNICNQIKQNNMSCLAVQS